MARRRLIRQARDETMLRYGPEERALGRLLRESRANLRLGIRAEEATAAGVKAAARAARPTIRKSYAEAGRAFEQADQDIQTLSGASSDAATREAAGARRRMAEALAGAESELKSREVDAEAGRAQGIQQRRRDYAAERGKTLEDLRDLRREEGLYAQTTYHGLVDDDRKFRQEGRRIRISAGNLRARRRHDRVTEGQAQQRIDETGRHNRQIEKDDAEKDKKKQRFTPLQLRGSRADWDTAKTRAEAYKKAGKLTADNAGDVAAHIADKFNVDLPLARAAVQVVLRGGVTPKTRKRIRRDYGLKPRREPDLDRTLTHLFSPGR